MSKYTNCNYQLLVGRQVNYGEPLCMNRNIALLLLYVSYILLQAIHIILGTFFLWENHLKLKPIFHIKKVLP